MILTSCELLCVLMLNSDISFGWHQVCDYGEESLRVLGRFGAGWQRMQILYFYRNREAEEFPSQMPITRRDAIPKRQEFLPQVPRSERMGE